MNDIKVKEINSKRDQKKFFKFPIKLYKNNSYFVPTLIGDELNEFNPKVNGAFLYSECKMFLAYRGNKIVGRIAGILNKAYNEKHTLKQVRFTRFDFIDDYEVSKALLKAVNDWAIEINMDELLGPIGFSDLDKQGLLTEGYDKTGMYITPYNFEYYVDHYLKLGLVKEAGWVEYRITVPEKMDERLEKLALRTMERSGYHILKLNKVKDAKPWFVEALKVLNESFEHLFGVVPLSDKQMVDFSSMLVLLGNVDYITAVLDKDNKVIGYGYVAPSISRAMIKNRGKVLPFGLFRVLRDLKTSKVADFYSIGVKPEYQNSGVNAIIMYNSLKGLIKNKMEFCETGPELEDNLAIQSQWKIFDREIHKRRACYKKNVE